MGHTSCVATKHPNSHYIPHAFAIHAMGRLHSAFEHGKLRGGALSRSKGGPLLRLIRAAVPKRLFSHFYVLGFATSALVLVDVLSYGGSLFTARVQVRGDLLDFVFLVACSRRSRSTRVLLRIESSNGHAVSRCLRAVSA